MVQKKSVKNWGIVKLSINIKIALKQKQFDYRSIIIQSLLPCSTKHPYPTRTNTNTHHDSSLYLFRKYHHPIDDSSPQQHPPKCQLNLRWWRGWCSRGRWEGDVGWLTNGDGSGDDPSVWGCCWGCAYAYEAVIVLAGAGRWLFDYLWRESTWAWAFFYRSER